MTVYSGVSSASFLSLSKKSFCQRIENSSTVLSPSAVRASKDGLRQQQPQEAVHHRRPAVSYADLISV